jgi:Zn-dependent membrane protease YugP
MISGYSFNFDSLILVLAAFLLSLIFQAGVRSTFAKFSHMGTRAGFPGKTVARRILDHYALNQIQIEHIAGQLTDHYDPRAQTLRLSDATFESSSVAAVGVAAHEAGHAVQHAEGYLPGRIRRLLVPIAQIGSSFGPYLSLFSMTTLLEAGILLYAGAVLFYLVTMPVEFNASFRAIQALDEQGLLTQEELAGVRRVLRAAAMTYVASALVAFATLLRFMFLARGRNEQGR